ncbi:beta-alanine transporter-like [Argiope bruennichi]|uniref:beta-alanine transporter-like n=1 Tax=Argiope bruennichi TaxID=94029 RepID=UPI00249409D1|nr:beta-alanine transporter-like [Argiope bruennichi]
MVEELLIQQQRKELKRLKGKRMSFAAILRDIGDFGPYQKILLLLFFIPCFTVIPFFSMHVIFLTGIPDHWCYVPEVAKSNLSLVVQKTLISPPSDPHCSMYDVNYTEILMSEESDYNENTPTKSCDKGWYYEKSEFDETAVTKWNLVCKDDHYVPLILATTFIGNFIGAQFFSSLANKIGRITTFKITALIITVADIGSSLSTTFWMVIFLRIIQGTAISTIYSTPYALLLELVRPDLRTWMNEVSSISWTAGLCLVPMLAWMTRNWVALSGVNSVCAFVLFLCSQSIPESPLWLISQKRFVKATDVLKMIGKFNRDSLPEDNQLLQRVKDFGDEYQRAVEDQTVNSPRDFFIYPILRKRCALVALIWLLNSVPYFGLQMNTRYLEGNKFVNFFLASIVEVPAHFATWICLARYGRRGCLLSTFVTASISCFLPFPFQTYKAVHVLVTFIVKGCTSSAYITLYIQGPELFPLILRAAGIGMCCTVGSIGGIIAPYAVYLYKYADYAPFLVFSAAMAIAAFCASCLPETVGRNLPVSAIEAENFERDWKYFDCAGCPKVDKVPLNQEAVFPLHETEEYRRRSTIHKAFTALFNNKSETAILMRNTL